MTQLHYVGGARIGQPDSGPSFMDQDVMPASWSDEDKAWAESVAGERAMREAEALLAETETLAECSLLSLAYAPIYQARAAGAALAESLAAFVAEPVESADCIVPEQDSYRVGPPRWFSQALATGALLLALAMPASAAKVPCPSGTPAGSTCYLVVKAPGQQCKGMTKLGKRCTRTVGVSKATGLCAQHKGQAVAK